YVGWYKLGLLDVDRALAVTLAWVRGRDEAAMRADCEAWYARTVRGYIYPAMAATVDAHRRLGHLLVLITSATRYLAEPLGADLGIEHFLVTRLLVADGLFTGEVVRPVCYGKGKVHSAEQFARAHDVDLARSFFYTDSVTDLPLLERVGEPRIVNPDPRLARIAARRGWPSVRLKLRDTA